MKTQAELEAKVARLEAARDKRDAEKNGSVIAVLDSKRPTVTRTVAGGILFGPIGALAGFAWRKRERNYLRVS